MTRRQKASPNVSRAEDLTLSTEQVEEIERRRKRYAKNYRAFAKDCLQVIDRDSPTGAKHIPFEFNNAQNYLDNLINDIGGFNEEMSKARAKIDKSAVVSQFPIRIVALKARKVGWSTYIQGRAFWKAEFNSGTNALVMAHEMLSSQNIMKISKRFDEHFTEQEYKSTPLPIRVPIARSADQVLEWGINPATNIAHDSRLIVKTAGTRSSGSSRGYTYHLTHISEEAHFADSDEVAAALAAAAYFSEQYEESTAKGVGGMFHESWEKALWLHDAREMWKNRQPFPTWWNGKFRAFWSWIDDPAYRMAVMDYEREQITNTMTPVEEELVRDYKCTIEQLAWRRWKIGSECTNQKEMEPEEYFKQEYPTTPEEAFVSKGVNVFNRGKLKKLEKESKDRRPVRQCSVKVIDKATEDASLAVMLVDVRVNPELVFWEKPIKGHSYVMGVDAAQGLAHGDYSTISLYDRCDGSMLREVARLASKHPPEELGIIAVHLALMYNEAFIVPEANNHGGATCLKIVRLRYPMVYHSEDPQLVTDHKDAEAFTCGFKTYVNTKPLLVGEAQAALRNDQLVICDETAIKEWINYRNEDGKFTAPDGEHDDRVMADMLAIFGHFSGKAPALRKDKLDIEDKDLTSIHNRDLRERVEKMLKRARRNNERAERAKMKRKNLLTPSEVIG